jgi:hypothetical protein
MRVVAAALLVAALLAVPATAGAQAPLPVGEADGVRIVRERGAIVVVFTSSAKKLWRRVAGRRVSVYCTEFLEGRDRGGRLDDSGSETWSQDQNRRSHSRARLLRRFARCSFGAEADSRHPVDAARRRLRR